MTSAFGESQDLVVSHFTGPEGGIGSRDARGTAARFNASGHTIRTVDLVTGETRTPAGNPALTGTENGSALDARFIGPDRIVGDGVNLYVSDNDIRKISTVASTRTFTISANGINYLATPAGSSLTQGHA